MKAKNPYGHDAIFAIRSGLLRQIERGLKIKLSREIKTQAAQLDIAFVLAWVVRYLHRLNCSYKMAVVKSIET